MNKGPARWRSFPRGLAEGRSKTVVPVSAGEPVMPEVPRPGPYGKDVARIVSLHQEALAMLRAVCEAQKQTQSSLGELRDALNIQISALRSLLQPTREVSGRVDQLLTRTLEPADLVARLGQDLDRRIRSAVEIAIADILTCLTDSSARVERSVEAALARMDLRPQPRPAPAVNATGGTGAESQAGPSGEDDEYVGARTSLPGVTPAREPAPSAPPWSMPPRRSRPSSPPLPPEALRRMAAAITRLRADSAADPEGLVTGLRALQDSTSGPIPQLPASQWARDKIRQALKAGASDTAKADSILGALLSKIEEHIQVGPPSPEGLRDDAAHPTPNTTGQPTGGEEQTGRIEPASTADESGLVIA
jgi:hypothetical protein